MSGTPLSNATNQNPNLVWYGKLPSAADFVGRRMPHAIESEWDAWIRSGLDQLRHEGGHKWHERFVHCPAWFFICPLRNGALAAGAIAPSIDRVGRYYPITIMALSPQAHGGFSNDAQVGRFFSGLLSAIIDARRIPFSPEQLDERLCCVSSPFASQIPTNSMIEDILVDLEAASSMPQDTSYFLPGLEWRNIFSLQSDTSVWWVSPSPKYRHEMAVHHGPLHRPLFTRLFKGSIA